MSSVFTFDKVPFEQRLAETIAWCVQRMRATDPKPTLRSQEISPQLLAQDRVVLVRSVAGWRSHRTRDVAAAVDRESLHGGRLLVYFPDADLFDGAAEVASRGFFDVHNAPRGTRGSRSPTMVRRMCRTGSIWSRGCHPSSSRARTTASWSIPKNASRRSTTQTLARGES
jgi:hypothetical protein